MPSPSMHGRRRVGRISLVAVVLALVAQLTPVPGPGLGPREVVAGPVCGSGEPLHGIDVSRHQGEINWPAVAGAGIRFGIARIGNGVTIRDWWFEANYAGMRTNGITPGSYIYWRPGQDPVAQGKIVAAALGRVGFEVGDIPPTIDVEEIDGQSPETIAERLRTTVTTIEQAIGVTPMIYLSPRFWRERVGSPEFADLPLWIAHWGVACPSIPTDWPAWTVWQTSSSGSVPGIAGRVDLDQTPGPSLPVYTGAPVLLPLPDIHVQGEVPTPVTFPARAVGYRGIGMPARCSPASGSLFQIGTTTVTCWAQNMFGSTAESFDVTVEVPLPPSFMTRFPNDISTDAPGGVGRRVTWAPVTATDHTGETIPASCLPSAGSLFPVGDSLVICRATDSFGRQVASSFTVSVGTRSHGHLRR